MKEGGFRLVERRKDRIFKYSCLNLVKNITNVSDCALPAFPKALLAEFIGTAILVMFGCGSVLTINEGLKPSAASIALAWGLTIAMVIWTLGHVSGAVINPCVSVALMIGRKMTFVKTLCYVAMQCGGGIAGAYVLYYSTPPSKRGNLGATLVAPGVDVWQAVVAEAMATFALILTVCATIDGRIDDHNGSKALSIGFVVAMDIPWVGQVTGASMNSARSLGPAVAMGIWDNHWVYWLGPMLGAITASLLYENIFAVNSSMLKTKEWLGSRDYNEDMIYQQLLESRRKARTDDFGEGESLSDVWELNHNETKV